jgi:hypothetical protein
MKAKSVNVLPALASSGAVEKAAVEKPTTPDTCLAPNTASRLLLFTAACIGVEDAQMGRG